MQHAARRSPKLLTLQEYEQLPDDGDGYRMELVRGMLVRERGPGPLHGRLQSRIAHWLEQYHEERGLVGAVMVNAGFVLQDDPPTVRIPDVAFVSPERIPDARYAERWWRNGPDLAVEVTSPSNSWTRIQEKVDDYFAAGTRIVWVVDPPTQTVTVYRSGLDARRLGADADLEGDDVLPGFRVKLSLLFRV